ncbi:MAG: hypothetical protein KDB27_28595, partial [Planctomycetales bacterium]|nr:hypothetical protein [Planctomycetales bacterium]
KFMESVYMLPGGGHVELLKSWAQTRPQPKTEIGQYPGWGEGFFRTKNSEFYWLIGHFLQGDNWQHVERLWQDDLRRPNGECNLPLVYATAFTAHTEGKGRDLLNLLDAAIDDETLNGNQKATWLIAKAFTLGALVDGEPRPMRGYQYLQEALLVAQSKPVRFWALQEMVARHASLDQADKANQLIEQYRGQFSDAESQGKFAAWSQQAEELKQKYVEVRKQPNFEPLEIYIAEVKRRLAKAQSNQKSDKATRLQAILQRAEQKLAAKEAL